MLVNSTSFFSRHFPTGYVDYAVTWLKAIFEIASTQSGGDEDKKRSWKEMILSIFSCSHEFICDQLWTNISEFVIKVSTLYTSIQSAVSFETLDMDAIMKGFCTFRNSLPKARDIIESIFIAFEYVAGNWKNIVKGDFSSIMLGKDESKDFEIEVRLLEQAYALLIEGREELCLREHKLTPALFEQRLVKAIEKSKSMIGRATSVQQRMSISTFTKTLNEKLTFWEKSKCNQTRTAQAYGLKLSGPSGTGKSTLMSIFSKVMLDAYGYENTEGLAVSANFSEKYESTVMPRHKVIMGDDVANNANEIPNYDRILNYVNTVRRPLEKAGVEQKGNMYPNNNGLIVTTNDESLKAIKASACPESILRRFVLDVEVKIREPYRNQYGGLIRLPSTRYDVYELTVRRFDRLEYPEDEEGNVLNGPPLIIWDVVPRSEWNPFNDDKHDFAAFCRFLSKDIKSHIKAQETSLKELKELDKSKICSKCSCPIPLCLCEELQKLVETDDEDTLSSVSDKLVSDDEDSLSSVSNISSKKDIAESLPKDILKRRDEALEGFDDQSDLRGLDFVESESEKSKAEAQFGGFLSTFSTRELWDMRAALGGCRDSIKNLYKNVVFYNKIYQNKQYLYSLLSIFALSPLVSAILSKEIGFFMFLTGVSLTIGSLVQWRIQIDAEIQNRFDRLSCLCEDVRTHLQNNMVKYFAAGASVVFLYKTYKLIRPLILTQDTTSYFKEKDELFGKLMDYPKNKNFVLKTQDERDYKEGYSRLPPEITNAAKCSSSEALTRAIEKHLRRVIVKSEGQMFSTVNGLMVASNVILIPSHAIPQSAYFDIETSTQKDTVSPGTKDQKLTMNFVYLNTERDFALVQLPSAPAGMSFAKFFPTEFPTFYSRATKMLFKTPDGDVIMSKQCSRPVAEPTYYSGFGETKVVIYGTRQVRMDFCLKPGQGLTHDLEFNTFGGLCGAPYIDAKQGIIYGFHVAGFANSPRGFSTLVIRSDIEEGLKYLDEKSSSLVVHSAGEVRVNAYDTNHTVVNAKPLCLREDGTGVNSRVIYIGQVLKDGLPMESRARPPYIPTPFKGVKENLGEPKHQPPSKPNDVAKAMPTLNKLMDPVQHYEHNILEKAIHDYREQTLKCIRENKEEASEMLRLYTQQEALDGIGEFGVEPVKSSTSAGFPINKSKKHCIVRDPMDETAPKVPREFTEEYDIQSEIDRTLKLWKEKTRSETIFKASSKVNELLPTKKALKKVRKFYGGEMSNLIASKMALAGIPRFMRRFWQSTECLVGINPGSKEWEEFHEYLTKHGDKHMIAGDFAGFDTRMAAQITGAAAQIMLDWYKEVGLSQDQLDLIKGALSEIIHPNILFEGFLFRFANGNPSGNLITVQLNSICNALMMRYVYYSLHPMVRERFSENVALGTYGDDNAMGVNRRCRWFTHTACQMEFAKLGIEYTMADKDAKSVPYITIDELSFLKRGFSKHETLNKIVAPIEEDSILKKFHWVKKPNESPLSFEEQFGAYTDGSFREAYLFGREYYDNFVSKIRNIVELNPELKHQVSFIPYDEMTNTLRPYYQDSYVNDNKKLFAESLGEDFEPNSAQSENLIDSDEDDDDSVPDLVRYDSDSEDEDEDDLTEDEMKTRIVQVTQRNATGPNGARVKAILFFLLFVFVLPIAQVEFLDWWRNRNNDGHLIRELYKRIVKNKENFFEKIDEAYLLNGPAGIANHLGIPVSFVKLFIKEDACSK
jgi:energy-coupling factor transporter ATP-binding protein EcfA2